MSFIDIAKSVSNIQGTIGAVRNFAESILSLFGKDVVAIFDGESFEQIFNNARPIKATINRQQKIMDHPIESGAIVSDFAIKLPLEIEISMVLTGEQYIDAYQNILSYYENQRPLYVETWADAYVNMYIQGMPHEENPDMFDVIPLSFRLRQVQEILVQYQALPATSVQQPQDQSTTNRGVQQPQESLLYAGVQAVKNVFSNLF